MRSMRRLCVLAALASVAHGVSQSEAECILRDKKIVYMGDSVTRFQYYGLNNFLSTGKLREDDYDGSEGYGEDSTDYDTFDTWTDWKRFSFTKDTHRMVCTKEFDDFDTEYYFIQDVWSDDDDTDGEENHMDLSEDLDFDIIMFNTGWWHLKDDGPRDCGRDWDSGCERDYEDRMEQTIEHLLSKAKGLAIFRTTTCCGEGDDPEDWIDSIKKQNALATQMIEDQRTGTKMEVVDVFDLYDEDDLDDATTDGRHANVEMTHKFDVLVLEKIDSALNLGCLDGSGGGGPVPTYQPTRKPTLDPTREPTRKPTADPTREPTYAPSRRPSDAPTPMPTNTPTRAPTTDHCVNGRIDSDETDLDCGGATCEKCDVGQSCIKPRDCLFATAECIDQVCAARPTAKPTQAPSTENAVAPTAKPTQAPTITAANTYAPTYDPTVAPTARPTQAPSTTVDTPVAEPTQRPTVETAEPTTAEEIYIIGFVRSTGIHTTLVALLEAADLDTLLDTAGPYTLFAPDDDAFAKLDPATLDLLILPENVDQLTAILKYHLVGSYVFSTNVFDGMTVTTLQGSPVTVSLVDGAVIINDATVTIADGITFNGLVHSIDTVLIPPDEQTPSTAPAPSPTSPQLGTITGLVGFEGLSTADSQTHSPVIQRGIASVAGVDVDAAAVTNARQDAVDYTIIGDGPTLREAQRRLEAASPEDLTAAMAAAAVSTDDDAAADVFARVRTVSVTSDLTYDGLLVDRDSNKKKNKTQIVSLERNLGALVVFLVGLCFLLTCGACLCVAARSSASSDAKYSSAPYSENSMQINQHSAGNSITAVDPNDI